MKLSLIACNEFLEDTQQLCHTGAQRILQTYISYPIELLWHRKVKPAGTGQDVLLD